MANYTFDHLHLRTADPEAMAAWFEKNLGAQVSRSQQGATTRIDLKLGGAEIFLAPVAPDSGVNPPPVTPYRGLDHFGLAVTDLDGVAADLKKKGVEFTMEPNNFRPGIRICFIRGPEGISIELLERNANFK